MPMVSWLMPVYQSEKTVVRAIKSMLAQTYQDFEIIIVLENGDIPTWKICKQYSEQDCRIKLLENPCKGGIANALNTGLKACSGKYIARMDGDDFSYPIRLAVQVSYMERYPDIGLIGSNARIIQYGNEIGKKYDFVPGEEEIRAKLLFETCFIHPTVMLRSDAYKWEYPNEKAEDYALFAEIISKVKMAILPDVLLDYYENGDNESLLSFSASSESSRTISRKAIRREFSIETSAYVDNHFGWRYYDAMPEKPFDFLRGSLHLLNTIWRENKRLKRFDEEVLYKALQDQWELSKWLVRPYNEVIRLYKGFEELTEQEIDNLEKQLNIYSNSNNAIVFYGVGKDLGRLQEQIDSIGLKIQIIGYCDSDKSKTGRDFRECKILSPKQLQDISFDYICISTAKYAAQIMECLIVQYGIEKDKICVFGTDIPDEVIRVHLRFCIHKKQLQKRIGKYAYLFCAPDYGNIGDHAIAIAEHQYFKENCGLELIEVPYTEYRLLENEVKRCITEDDILFITGGGFLGSLWSDAEFQVRRIIETFSRNRICILPQTLYWEKGVQWDSEKKKTSKIYVEHGDNLLLCARDEVTKQLMNEIYSGCKIVTAPDMVLSYDWAEYLCEAERKGAILCLKADKESILDESYKKDLKNICMKLCNEVKDVSTNVTGYYSEEEREELIKYIIRMFSSAELVVTDRLHGLLFSVITGTPCVALNNCNHKVRETFRWVERVGNIRFCDEMGQFENVAEEVYRRGPLKYRSADYIGKFDVIRKSITQWLKDTKAVED